MTGSKDLVVDVQKIPSMPTNVKWGDALSSKVLGLGEVVISHDLTIEKVMLVESLAYNLLSVRQLALMGFATFFDVDTVALLWSKTLKVAFVGHVENSLYVINFLEQPTKTATCLMAKVDVGCLMSFLVMRGSSINIPHLTPLNKMVLRRGRTGC